MAHNPGQGKVTRSVASPSWGSRRTIRLVPLDLVAKEWGWYQSEVAILKIDVEGLEKDVVQGATSFLNSQRVQNIFLEGNVATNTGDKDFKEMVGILSGAGYRAHRMGGYLGPRHDIVLTDAELQNVAESLAFRCKGGGKERKQCNIWWKLAGRS